MTDGPAFGSLAWALAGNGRTTTRERLAEATRSTAVIGPLMAQRAADRLGIAARGTVRLDLDAVPFPDSRIAREAEEECRDTVSPMLFHHSVRTYLFGVMLAQRDGLQPDLELFYVASLLHDLTLGDVHRDFDPMPCFAARGGLLARAWTAERGWDADRQETVANAISMHLNTVVDPSFGPEAQMLQAGAGVDTIGLRKRQLDPGSVAAILERFPRHGMKKKGPLTFGGAEHRGTRAGDLNRIGFGLMVRTAGFPD